MFGSGVDTEFYSLRQSNEVFGRLTMYTGHRSDIACQLLDVYPSGLCSALLNQTVLGSNFFDEFLMGIVT